MIRPGSTLATGVGLALLALHAAALPILLDHFHRPSLTVDLTAPAAAPALDTSASVPDELFKRIAMTIDGDDPDAADRQRSGLRRISWSVDYRGGFRDRVGASQLVGPFQDLSSPPCALWVVVGQRFLGSRDTDPEPGTLAALLGDIIDREMSGFAQWPIGRFIAASDIDMRWLAFDDVDGVSRRLAIIAAAGGPLAGVLRVSLILRFEEGEIPVWFALIPRLDGDSIRLRTHVEAALDLDNRVYQWVADLFEGDELVSDIAGDQVDTALIDAFGLPPPIALGEGHQLRFGYCDDQPMQIVTGSHAAVPLRLLPAPGPDHRSEEQSGDSSGQPVIWPVRLSSDAGHPGATGLAERLTSRSFTAPLSVVFELDVINGVLHQLWTSGFLDRQLIDAGLAERFNRDPMVQELLSVRVGKPHLRLPPTLMPSPMATDADRPEFDLGLEVALDLHDRDAVMPARLFGSVGFGFGDRAPAGLVARLRLDELALTCHPRPDRLVPCYGNLVAAFRDRADDIHGVLSRSFTTLFEDIALQRTIDLETARFRIDRASVHTRREPTGGAVRVDLFGVLVDAAD